MEEFDYEYLEQLITPKEDVTQQIIIEEKKCPKCGSFNLSHDDKTTNNVCMNCGYIIQNYDCAEVIDVYKKPSITKSIIPQFHSNLRIRGLNNIYIKNIQQWNNTTYKDRSLYLILKLIKKKCKELKLNTCIIDEAKLFYYNIIVKCYLKDKKISHKLNQKSKSIKFNVSRGKNKLGIVAACIYYACKKTGYMHTIKEIAKVFDITTACINNGCKIFIKNIKKSSIDFNILVSKPSNFVNYLCEILNIPIDKIKDIKDLVDKIEKNYIITDHTPYSIAIAAIIFYVNVTNLKLDIKFPIQRKLKRNEDEIITDEIRTKNNIHKISKKLNVSAATIIKVYNILNSHRDFLCGLIIKNDATSTSLIKSFCKNCDEISIIESQNIILSENEKEEKIKKIKNIDPDNYKCLNNINLSEIVFNINETIINNDFVKSLIFF